MKFNLVDYIARVARYLRLVISKIGQLDQNYDTIKLKTLVFEIFEKLKGTRPFFQYFVKVGLSVFTSLHSLYLFFRFRSG